MTTAPAVEASGLVLKYGDFEAVRGVDIAVAPGEVFAFLGPNGAGKTSTVEVLEGFRSPSQGHVRVLGLNPYTQGRQLRSRIGVVLQEGGLFPEMTVRETVHAWRRFYPQAIDTDVALARVDLAGRANVRVKDLSGGEKRRLDLALGTLHTPEVLFLDEPTTGFDPGARRHAWDLIRSMASGGTTIFLTTHYLEEAEVLADRVAVISGGRIIASGTPESLRTAQGVGVVSFRLPAGTNIEDLPDAARATTEVDGNVVTVSAQELTAMTHTITGWAVNRGIELDGLNVHHPSLEDVYLQLVSSDADAASSTPGVTPGHTP